MPVTSAKDIHKLRQEREQGLELPLPSGITVRVRNVPFRLLLDGSDTITDGLKLLIAREVRGEADARQQVLDALEDDPTRVMRLQNEMVDAVCKAALVEPKIVDKPNYSKGQIHISDLSEEDKEVIYGLLDLPASHLRKFCEGQAENVARLDAEPTGGHDAERGTAD